MSDILIAGAGIVGLSLAVELHARGARVTVLERDTALSHASTAAAGMLAADDPHNPPILHPLSCYSIALYAPYLARITSLSGIPVPYQTSLTHQYASDGVSTTLAEHSLDPRQLAASLLAAVRSTSIDLREHTPLQFTEETPRGVIAHTRQGERIVAKTLIYATGAWTDPHRLRQVNIPVVPRKGQMLRVQLPASLPLQEVHRSEHVYIVPRTQGPQAGTAVIGATVEDAGFDITTHPADLDGLRAQASVLLHQLSSAPAVESWAGIRPATPDNLPILGRLGYSQEFVATGHFRNGILLAPATAVLLADLVEYKTPAVDLAPFLPQRFAAITAQ